jgi:GNAT superfamily N-acetyltransferase
MTVTVRSMTQSDTAAVAELTRQLGYEVTADEIAQRYTRLASDPGSVALVADAAGRIVGWIHALDRVLLQWKRVLEIGGLVIDQDRRGEGIGAGLVDAVAEWAQLHGHTTLFVRSNVVREGAHDFYPALGFAHWKTSHTYVKEL